MIAKDVYWLATNELSALCGTFDSEHSRCSYNREEVSARIGLPVCFQHLLFDIVIQ